MGSQALATLINTEKRVCHILAAGTGSGAPRA